jgi:hypothetical protein
MENVRCDMPAESASWRSRQGKMKEIVYILNNYVLGLHLRESNMIKGVK